MDNQKVRLSVAEVSYTEAPLRSFIVLLAEADGPRRLPVVIGAAEAQAIAIELEQVSAVRPSTHDLFFDFARAFNIELLEVDIVKVDDGVFYAELLCYDGRREVRLDSRTSDAIALALRFRCPIFTTPQVMDQAGLVMSPIDPATDANATAAPTIDDLQRRMDKAVKDENYELASQLRDDIKRLRNTPPAVSPAV